MPTNHWLANLLVLYCDLDWRFYHCHYTSFLALPVVLFFLFISTICPGFPAWPIEVLPLHRLLRHEFPFFDLTASGTGKLRPIVLGFFQHRSIIYYIFVSHLISYDLETRLSCCKHPPPNSFLAKSRRYTHPFGHRT